MGVEAALLSLFMIYGGEVIRGGETRANSTWEFYSLVALPAFAMGLQDAALRRVGGRTVRTTYVTGTLTNLGEDCVAYLYWLRDRRWGVLSVFFATRFRLLHTVSYRKVGLTDVETHFYNYTHGHQFKVIAAVPKRLLALDP